MKYRNTSNQTQALIGFGVVEPGKTIETSREINNPNFELVKEESREEPKQRRVKKQWQKI